MTKYFLLLTFLLNVSVAVVSRAEDVDGVKMLTPNQQRRIVQINHDLPTDVLDHPGTPIRWPNCG